MSSGLIFGPDGDDITMDALSAAVEGCTAEPCERCHKGPLTGDGIYRDAHVPCCSSHRKILCCECYRITHLVEVLPCH